ncbi:SsgA family sporulation/cell division regulator [Streptomyces sp. Q6]|uniref:SsgA family sporulation/cell division regulator n=1 Tax=Streptomyces citrinus TaxID=3118173 RepID=A0ACD5A4M7_9ACTN
MTDPGAAGFETGRARTGRTVEETMMRNCQLDLPLTLTRWVTSDHQVAVDSVFTYDPCDPLVVTVAFQAADEWPVRWAVARDLIADGLATRSGEGDVALWPLYDLGSDPVSVCLRVSNPGGTALFEIPYEPIAAWLDETYGLVARGGELDGVEWDDLLQPAD